MKKLFAILFTVCSLSAADLTTVIFSTEQVTGVPLTNTLVEFRPLGLLTWSNRIVPLIPFTNRTDSSGNFTTNFIPGSYRVTIFDSRANTPFTNSFPESATPIYAADYITVGTNTVAGMAYNQATSLNLFAKRTNAIRILTNGVSAAAGYTNINFTSGVTGYLSGATLNLGVNATGGSGDAGGTNARQWGTLTLTNLAGTGAITNAPWTNSYQSASAILTNISGTGALTNAADFQPASAVLSNAVATGVLTNPAVFQPSSATLTNLASNPVKDYTNRLIAGTSITLTTNSGGTVTIASTASGGGITTNANHFAANDTLNIKDGALLTNIIFTAGIDTGANRSNWVFNTQSGRVYADFRCIEAGLRTVWVTNSLVTANSVVIVCHAGTNAITGPLLPPLAHSVATGILKIHMSPSSWNTIGNVATVSWFITNPGQ